MIMEYPDHEPPKRGTYFDVIFALIVLLASGFSAFTTYLGFSKDLPQYMSIPIASIIGLGLLGINFKIRFARRKDEGFRGPFVVFFVVFIFSFISNTNAFYSRIIEEDIVRETQDEAWERFDQESNKALKLIEDNSNYRAESRRIAEVENELTKLRDQTTDPRNPGLGERALEHLRRIEILLQTDVTNLASPSPESSIQQHEKFATEMERHIRELIEERKTRGVVYGYASLHEEIEQMREVHKRRVDENDYRRDNTDEMHRDLKAVENQINRIMSPTPELKLEEINDKADEIGKFKYTWRNFSQWVSPVAIWLSVILGALLDLIAPAMSLALYRAEYD